jgi:hypothetical protein
LTPGFGIRDGKKNPDLGSAGSVINIPDHFSESLVKIQYLNSLLQIRIRDPMPFVSGSGLSRIRNTASLSPFHGIAIFRIKSEVGDLEMNVLLIYYLLHILRSDRQQVDLVSQSFACLEYRRKLVDK